MNLREGTILQGGKYRIERELGHGGFGITYLAVQVGLNRRVAIKEFFMSEYCNRDAETSHVSVPSEGSKELVARFRTKFIKEAQTIAEMDNHHIIRIHDVFEENGTAYYVMEYLPGGDLRSRIPSGGMPEAEAVGYIREVADALRYIHCKNILHLDIKPTNILFRGDGEAVLIDFGISKHYDDEGGSQTSSTPVGISEGYAPTEQYEREGVSSFAASTDIYSLGATLYCLLSGGRPPKASIVLNEGLPALPSRVSVATRTAVEQAMQPRRKDRPQSVDAFLALLDAEVQVEDERTVLDDERSANKQTEANCPSEAGGRAERNDVKRSGGGMTSPMSASSSSSLKKFLLPAVACLAIVLAVIFWPKPVVVNETLTEKPKPQQQSQSTASSSTTSGNRKTYTVNGVSFTMVRIAGGTFTMGASSSDSEAYDDEKPAHQVTLGSYSIGETEVTQALWQAVMGSNPSHFTGNLQRPVEMVSWNECQAFIRKLNALTGVTFRLPTEAEWEYAARGGSQSRGYKYSGSDNLGSVAWYYDNSSNTTHPVKGKQPNELGLYDMSGNVWEWCADWYGSYSSSSQTNPKGPSAGSYRVCRGGSWFNSAWLCRVSNRGSNTPSYSYCNLGLRLASQ